MDTLQQDLKFAFRMMTRNPGFLSAAVICLALGIGATSVIFTVVNAVLLRPLPYKDPERLARVYTEFPTFPNGGLRRFSMSAPEWLDLKRDIKSFESFETLDIWFTGGANLASSSQGDSNPIRATTTFMSGGVLPVVVGLHEDDVEAVLEEIISAGGARLDGAVAEDHTCAEMKIEGSHGRFNQAALLASARAARSSR